MCFTVSVPVILFRVCKSSWHACELYTRVGFQRCAGHGACVLKKQQQQITAVLFWRNVFGENISGIFARSIFCSLAWPAMVSWYQPIRLSELHACLFVFCFIFLLVFLFVVVVVVVCLCVCCCFYKHFQHGAVLLFGRLNGKFVFIEMPHL